MSVGFLGYRGVGARCVAECVAVQAEGLGGDTDAVRV